MIKNIWNISLKDYDIIERYGVISHLKKPFNILPVILFHREINKRINEVTNHFDTKDNAKYEIENEIYKIKSREIIKGVSANYDYLLFLLDVKTKIDWYKKRLNRKIKRKLKSNETSSEVNKYLKKINQYTGKDFKLNTYSDIKKIKDHLEWLIDKYNENYPVKKQNNNKIYLMDIAIGVFSFMEQPINENMSITAFISLYNKSEEKYNAIQAQNIKHG